MTKNWDDLADVENQKSQPKSLFLIDGNNLAYDGYNVRTIIIFKMIIYALLKVYLKVIMQKKL